jgi:hypothetical protein
MRRFFIGLKTSKIKTAANKYISVFLLVIALHKTPLTITKPQLTKKRLAAHVRVLSFTAKLIA